MGKKTTQYIKLSSRSTLLRATSYLLSSDKQLWKQLSPCRVVGHFKTGFLVRVLVSNTLLPRLLGKGELSDLAAKVSVHPSAELAYSMER